MEEAVLAHTKIDEYRLDTRFEVYDFSFVNVPNKVVSAGAFNVEFFQLSVFDDGNATLFVLHCVDKHLFFHLSWLSCLSGAAQHWVEHTI